MGQWCDLAVDLVMMIEEQLILYIDKVRLRAVCNLWNTVLTKLPNLQVNQLPFLFHNIYENEEATHGLFNPHDKNIHLLNLPDVKGNLLLGSSSGWLRTRDHYGSSTCLKNPLTGRRIQIPPCPCHVFSNENIVLSPPTSKDDCMAVAIYDETRLAYCKCRDEKWKYLSDDASDVRDIIFHKGKLYALLDGLHLAIYDFESSNPTNFTLIASELPQNTDIGCCSYLVESSAQELMMVLKETCCVYAVYDPGSPDSGGELRETLFHVYKYDPVKQGWDKVKSIGDEVIFVDHMSCISVSCRSFPGFKGNQIYFVNEDCCTYHWQEISNIEVFNLDDETTESLSDFQINHMSHRHFPVWVRPILF